MRVVALFKRSTLALASAALLLPQTVAVGADRTHIAGPQDAAAEATVQDVALSVGGVLQGQVLSPEGLPIAQAPVTVWAAGQRIASTQTDSEGDFVVAGLRGGTYTLAAAGGSNVYRLWAENTAPPQAGQGVLIVSSGDATRGQSGVRPLWPPRTTTLALAVFAGGIVAGGLIGQANSSGS